jgi:hypothetical protein
MMGYKQAEASQEDIPNSTNGDQHSEIIKLNEPFSLRMSMYEKMIIHFQHFYNDQDVLSLSSLLLIPLCLPDVLRIINLWSPQSWDRRTNLTFGDTSKMSLFNSLVMKGSDRIADGYRYCFEKLPDTVILLHSWVVEDHDEEVILRAPYEYFFKMPMIITNQSIQCISSVESHGKDFASKDMHMVDIQLNGCIELHFTENFISQIFDHVTYMSSSFVSMEAVLKHLGYL